MRLTFLTDIGQSFVIEIDPQMELENIMALLEAEASANHSVLFNIQTSPFLEVWNSDWRAKYLVRRARTQ